QPMRPLSAAAAGQAMCEVLLRLREASGELALPGSFLPAAERYGMMPNVDRWVLCAALADVALDRDDAPFAAYSINLSGQSLSDASFPEFVIATLKRTGVALRRVCFE